MIKFDLPVAGGNTSNTKSSKELVISSYQGNLVRSPYDGVVHSFDPNKCGGHIKIQHNVNNETYFSDFCEVNRITVNRGDNLRKGSSVGIMGDKDITYSILDGGNRKVSFKPFFEGVDTESKTETKYKKEKESNKTVSSTNDLGVSKSGDKSGDSSHDLGVPKDTDSQDIFSKIGLSPFNLAHKLMGPKFRPVESVEIDTDILKEELDRIKQLLK